MMRPATLVLLGLAGVAGATLFSVSYDVSELETRLATLNRQIVDDQEATHVLRAEWSFLNQPAKETADWAARVQFQVRGDVAVCRIGEDVVTTDFGQMKSQIAQSAP